MQATIQVVTIFEAFPLFLSSATRINLLTMLSIILEDKLSDIFLLSLMNEI